MLSPRCPRCLYQGWFHCLSTLLHKFCLWGFCYGGCLVGGGGRWVFREFRPSIGSGLDRDVGTPRWKQAAPLLLCLSASLPKFVNSDNSGLRCAGDGALDSCHCLWPSDGWIGSTGAPPACRALGWGARVFRGLGSCTFMCWKLCSARVEKSKCNIRQLCTKPA